MRSVVDALLQCRQLEGWDRFSLAQQDALVDVHQTAKWRAEDGMGFDLIAWEGDDPVVYIFDRHEAFVLRRDGSLEESPEPEAVSA